MQRKLVAAAIASVVVAGLALAGCTSGGNPGDSTPAATDSTGAPAWQSKLTADGKLITPATVSISVASKSVLDLGSPLWAEQLGVLKDYGITLNVQSVATDQAVPLLATGKLDLIIGGLNAGLFNAVYGGTSLKVIAPNNVQSPDSTIGFYASTAATGGSGELTAANLKSGKIASSQGNQGISMVALTQLLSKFGLTAKDIQLVTMAQTDQVAALQNGAILLGTPSPAGTLALRQSGAAKYAGPQIPNGWPVTVFMAGPSLLKDRPEVAAAFVTAMRQTFAKYLQPGYSKNQTSLDAILKVSGLTATAVQGSTEFLFNTKMAIPSDYVSGMDTAWRGFAGVLQSPKPMTFDQIIDTEFMDYANAH